MSRTDRILQALSVIVLWVAGLVSPTQAAQELSDASTPAPPAGIAIHSLVSAPGKPDAVDFVRDIKPILEKHCLECHGPTKEEDFRIDDREAAFDYVIPGEADSSQMYAVLISEDDEERMPPPEEGDPLEGKQIQLIKDWIDQGANWPEGVVFEEPAAGESPQTGTGSAPQDGAPAPQKAPDQVPEQTPEPSDSKVGETSQGSAPVDGAQEKETVAPPSKGEQETPSAAPPVQENRTPGGNANPRRTDSKKEYSLWNAIGSLHPAVLHLPVGLLIAAGLFALIGFRGNFVMSDCAYYCLWLGMWGAILACITGWWFSPMEGRGTVVNVSDLTDQSHPVFWHRSSALVMTVLAFLLCLFAKSARARDPDDGFLWKLGAVLLAVAVGFVGHTGGELTHGKNLYKDLFGLIEESTGWDLGVSSGTNAGVVRQRPGVGLNRTRDPEKIKEKLSHPDDVGSGITGAGLIE